MMRCGKLLLPLHVVAAMVDPPPQADRAVAVQQVQYLSWYSYAGVVAASPGRQHANLAMNSDLGFLNQSYQQLNVSGMLVLQHSKWDAAIFAPPPWGGPYPGGLQAATWEGAVDDIVASLRPLPFVVGVMIGDELVCSGFPLANLSALASRLRGGLLSREVFIYTNECFPAGAPCKTDADCRGNSKQPGVCANQSSGLPVRGCQAAVWPEMPSGLDFISMDVYRMGYGARFRTEICIRGCHWIPRMFTGSEHACDQWHSSRESASYRCHHKSCRNTEGRRRLLGRDSSTRNTCYPSSSLTSVSSWFLVSSARMARTAMPVPRRPPTRLLSRSWQRIGAGRMILPAPLLG
jgi:hypothetical protein